MSARRPDRETMGSQLCRPGARRRHRTGRQMPAGPNALSFPQTGNSTSFQGSSRNRPGHGPRTMIRDPRPTIIGSAVRAFRVRLLSPATTTPPTITMMDVINGRKCLLGAGWRWARVWGLRLSPSQSSLNVDRGPHGRPSPAVASGPRAGHKKSGCSRPSGESRSSTAGRPCR